VSLLKILILIILNLFQKNHTLKNLKKHLTPMSHLLYSCLHPSRCIILPLALVFHPTDWGRSLLEPISPNHFHFNPTATLLEHALLAQGFMSTSNVAFPRCW